MTTHVLEARLRLDGARDQRAPGAAITVELCGHWEHEGACRWPHHTAVTERTGDVLAIRVDYTADDGPEVRRRIVAALADGELDGTTWTVLDVSP